MLKVKIDKKFMHVFVFGAFAIAMIHTMYSIGELIISFLIGLYLFAPLGFFAAWYLGNTYRLCSILRKLTKINYFVVHLVSRDGRNIATTIKNLDDDLLEMQGHLWIIKRGRIYANVGTTQEDTEGKELIPNYLAGVPCVFLDYHSCMPISLSSNKEEDTSSRELYSILRAWVITKEAELLRFKKMTQTFILICILAASASAVLAFKVMLDVQTLTAEVSSLKEVLVELKPIASALPKVIS